MPGTNRIIKLNSINRHTVDNQQCILLDNQQDSLAHIHRLALVPAEEKIKSDGSREISFPDGDLVLLNKTKVEDGLFRIGFQMQTTYGYLVLGIVPPGVIPEFNGQGNFQSAGASSVRKGSTEYGHRDPQLAREWIEAHQDWVQTNGILIYA